MGKSQMSEYLQGKKVRKTKSPTYFPQENGTNKMRNIFVKRKRKNAK